MTSKLQLPDMQRVVVGVDPSGTSGSDRDLEKANDVGIVVVGLGVDGVCYVLADLTCNLGPNGWARRVDEAYTKYQADRTVVERNFGGAMVESTLRTVNPNMSIKLVTASRGKVARAEPVAALFEQGLVKFAGHFPELEDELVQFTSDGFLGGSSPNRCIAKGELVETARGAVPIEQVDAEDFVLTRAGYKRVLSFGRTRCDAAVMTVDTTVGSITGTPDHPIWTENRGWVRLDALAWDDILLSCRESSMIRQTRPSAPRLCGIGGRNLELEKMVITSHLGGLTESCFISKFGRTLTGERHQKVTSYTTSTITSTTMLHAILSRLLIRSTPVFTNLIMLLDVPKRVIRSVLQKLCWLLPSGIEVLLVGRGTSSMGRRHGLLVNGLSPKLATVAVSTLMHFLDGLNSALSPATIEPVLQTTNINSRLNANCVENYFGKAFTGRKARPDYIVPAHVLGLRAGSAVADVYDLTVCGAHEFFVNGILVHNSDALIWAVTDLVLRRRFEIPDEVGLPIV